MNPLDPRAIIEAAKRAHGRVDIRAFAYSRLLPASTKLSDLYYCIGVAETLKRIMGDETPEPWDEYYSPESRLTELLNEYHAFTRAAPPPGWKFPIWRGEPLAQGRAFESGGVGITRELGPGAIGISALSELSTASVAQSANVQPQHPPLPSTAEPQKPVAKQKEK